VLECRIVGYLNAYVHEAGVQSAFVILELLFKRHYVSAKTKSGCREKLRQAMSDADRGLVFDAGALTLGEYLDKWLASIKDTVRQRTWERYEQLVRVHIKPALGWLKLKDLTRAHVKELYREKLDAGSSPRTVQYIHTTIHKALKDAMVDGLINKNEAAHIKLPKPRKKEINPLNPEQAKSFLEAARGDRYEALYMLAIHYGLRQGELLGIKWVDLDGNTLQVRRTMSEARSGRIEEQPKSGKGRRIELSESVREALRSHRERQQEEIEGSLPESGAYIRLFRGYRDELQEPLLALLQADIRACGAAGH
jgi:integrase